MLLGSCLGMDAMRELPLQEHDLAHAKDGVFEGHFSQDRWHFTVNVHIESGRIDTIVVQDCPGKGTESFDQVNSKLVSRVIRQQTVMVDAVSGSTITSKCFFKAMEDALGKAVGKNRQ